MSYKQQKLYFFFIIVISFCYSCKSLDASFPDLENVEIEKLEVKESVMNIQMQVNMEPMLSLVEKNTPKNFKGVKNTCEGVSYDYHFRRDPIHFSTSSNEVKYKLSGDFSLELNYCPLCVTLLGVSSCTIPRIYGSCGVDEPRIRYSMTYGTTIKLNKDYSLSSTTRLKNFNIKDPCEITFINYDVTNKVKEEIEAELKGMEESIDEEISQINLKTKVDSVWREFKKPIEIASYGFLHVNPKRITISDIKYQNKTAHFSLNLFFSPFLSTQKEETINYNLVDMPNHQEVNGFDITADFKASYDSLSSLLKKEFYNYEVLAKGRRFVIKDLGIVGTNAGKLVFKVVFDGYRKGTFYLTGTPVLNGDKQVLSFEDIDFEFKTKSFLLKSAQWLMSKSVISAMKEKATIDLSENLEVVKTSLMGKLNGEINNDIHAQTNIRELRVLKLLLSSNSIAIRTSITGDLKISID